MKIFVYHLTASHYLRECMHHSADPLDRPEVKRSINQFYDAGSFGSNTVRREIWNDNNEDLKYVKVATVTIESNDMIFALERAFELTNHVDHNWTLNPEASVETNVLCRSSRTGDIFILDDVKYVVDSSGFSKLEE